LSSGGDDVGQSNISLRRDPFERAHVTSNTYDDWMIDRVFFLLAALAYVGQFLETFGTILTMVLVPTFYATLYGIKSPATS